MIVTKFNYKPYPGKKITQVSQTVPDQSMSIREILQRHARGLPLGGNPNPPVYYGEESELGEIAQSYRHMDLADQEDFIANHKRKLKKQEAELTEARKSKEKAQKQPVEQADPSKKPVEPAGTNNNLIY